MASVEGEAEHGRQTRHKTAKVIKPEKVFFMLYSLIVCYRYVTVKNARKFRPGSGPLPSN
jgi:hypothetical protein